MLSLCTCYVQMHWVKESLRIIIIKHGSIKKISPVTHKHATSQGLSAHLKFLACESSGPWGSRGSTQPFFLLLTTAAPLHLTHPCGPCVLCPENSRKQQPQAPSLQHGLTFIFISTLQPWFKKKWFTANCSTFFFQDT